MFDLITYNNYQPTGWIRRQLELQLKGLSGNLHKVWPSVRDSAWIGGTSDSWERVPYWLDGAIPMAYLLQDKEMMSVVDHYIKAIVDRQEEDGWLCPCKPEERAGYDPWGCLLIAKVLALYCQFTSSKEIFSALYRFMLCCHRLLKKGEIKLYNWGAYRWFEGLVPLQYLYQKQPEPWMKEMGHILREQGVDFTKLTHRWERPIYQWTLDTHIVNLCMMLKYEALTVSFLGIEEDAGKAEELWQILEKYNGTAVGTFTGDECLSGHDNNKGTELCSVVELMYSCEELYRATGKTVWADRLEKLAFNALPATISDDMWTHQYDQMVNQMACADLIQGTTHFGTNDANAHMFGLEPSYGCCTANFHQGWPKLAMNTFLQTGSGILCALLLPGKITTKVKNLPVTVETITQYPFRHTATIRVTAPTPVEFSLKIRVPRFARQVLVNGKPVSRKNVIVLRKTWEGEESVTIAFTDTPHFVSRPLGLKTVEYGPLVFSLPIEAEYKMHEYERDGVERKFPYCDYELFPKSEWRYGFGGDQITVCETPGDDIPFSSKNPSLRLQVPMCRVDWELKTGYAYVADLRPKSRKALSEPQVMELYPYGCAKLRMTEMPITLQK